MVHLVENLHQCRLRSTEGQNHSPVDPQIFDPLKGEGLCLCLLVRPRFSWVTSSNNILSSRVSPVLHRVCHHFLIDPVDVICHAGVHPWCVLLSAPVAPANHAHQSHPAVAGTDQWATRVSLRGHTNKIEAEIKKNPSCPIYVPFCLLSIWTTSGAFSLPFLPLSLTHPSSTLI